MLPRGRAGLMLAVLRESFWERLTGVLALKRLTFETIQRDPEATSQAWWIVVLLGLANGIALIASPVVTVFPGMSEQMAGNAAEVAAVFTFDTTGRRLMALVASIIGAVISW